ncbi:FimV/HubP family polar landmark protein [Noviherbaspirillum sp. ST9]|uniref:FimV/HubP family polar landmark protein n=1 Tax=Noviherbaspirillum sp. ST9 TaxID=3401606 RepID=UPI003B5871F7
MHSNKRPTSGLFNLKTLSAAVASALVFSNAYAAGLGKLTVLSSLGQPLRAEIELTAVSKDEVGALTAKLASAEAYRQANIDFHPALMTLRFGVEQRGDRQFIRLSSSQPLNEPFVDMLLELSGPNGRLVREYTFLLDPADLRTTQSAQVAPTPVPESAAPAAQPRTAQAESAPASRAASPARVQRAEPAPRAARPAPAPVEAGADASQGEYRVRNGDTLARIANQVKPSGVSLDQMLVALYQSNPDAFVGNNMNRLKAGQILSVPEADKARSISAAEARGIVVAQSADFNNYRNKLAGQVASAAPQKSAESKQTAGGKITAKVEEKATPASESKDKLKLSNAQPAPAGAADKTGPATQEDKIAREKAIADANSRVKELEKNVTELQKLLEVKNKALADQQKQADAAATKPAAPAAPAAVEQKPAEAKVEKPAEVKPAEVKSAESNAEKPAQPAAPPVSAAPAPAPEKPKAVTPPPAPAPEPPSFFDELLGNPMVLPGIGALLVALGALGVYRARRQKQSKQFEDSIITDSSLKANSLFGSTGGQSVDTSNSVFNSSFAPSASQLDTNEVDPVAEADVYIAYGRDAQAEEILKEALRTQPDRHAVRVKLLEIYSNRKDLRAFEVLATELYGLTKGEGDDWAQAASMGAAIDPNNPLYAGGKKDDADVPLIAPTQPLDEQGLATLLSSTQSDTSQLGTIDGLDADASYFNNTELADETANTPAPAVEPETEPEPEPENKVTSNDLDFDLDGMQDLVPPNTIPRPAPAEPPADLTSIDFNFLDEPAKPAEPEAASTLDMTPAPEPLPDTTAELSASIPPIDDLEFSLGDDKPAEAAAPASLVEDISLDALAPPAESSIPEITDLSLPMEEPKAEVPAADPLDFDLSGISLELNPQETSAADIPATEEIAPEPVAEFDMGESEPAAPAPAEAAASLELPDLDFDSMNTQMLTDDPDANSAEMATKLDLAIAYQEIGDKEGARELLDEVLKGGTPEQSERAKALLLELA